MRFDETIRKAIKVYHQLDKAKESVSRSFNRVERALDRQESRVIKLIRRNYPDHAVISNGKAHVLIDGSLYVLDILDLENGDCMRDICDLEYRSINPVFDPFDLSDAGEDVSTVINDGEVS